MKTASFIVLGVAVLLTTAFHFFFAEHPFGLPSAILVALTLLGIHLLLHVGHHRPNRWAYLFLVPIAFATVAKILYASDVVQVLGFGITVVSLALYAYWISAPHVAFSQIKSLWPFSLIIGTIWPFHSFEKLFSNLHNGKQGGRMLIGLALAIPFLFIICGLFASADPLFNKAITDLFTNFELNELIGKTIRDMVLCVFFLGSGWMVAMRIVEKREPSANIQAPDPGTTVLATFLGLLNLLFLVFVGFQLAYFFGGESFIRDQGLTYAEYARSGFFQLLAVAGLVFFISWSIYWATGLRNMVTKALASLLILQTFVISFSAAKRLSLYVDVYGLSVSRWWAFASIALIAVVLLFLLICAWARRPFSMVSKFIGLGVPLIVSALLLVNVECLVVRINAERFLSGKTDIVDVPYMLELSSDAVPAMVTFANANWKTEDPEIDEQGRLFYDGDKGFETHVNAHQAFISSIQQKAQQMRTNASDWRNFSLSQALAMRSAESLK